MKLAKKNDRRITVRLVKGAYWDYETVVHRRKGWPVPVFLEKGDTDLNYETHQNILENTRYVRPAIATHNVRSISHAIAVADALNLPKDAFEFQMIYGMAEPVRNTLGANGLSGKSIHTSGGTQPRHGVFDQEVARKHFQRVGFLQNLFSNSSRLKS